MNDYRQEDAVFRAMRRTTRRRKALKKYNLCMIGLFLVFVLIGWLCNMEWLPAEYAGLFMMATVGFMGFITGANLPVLCSKGGRY